ncbi:MAG: transglycosylase SLT domain-containing protein [Inquilinaceae bacterium]
MTATTALHTVGAYKVSDTVMRAVKDASRETGVNYAFMMAKAAQESGFKPDAKAATSSATGLYQFIDQTWLDMVKTHGAKHGLGSYAGKIDTGPGGSARVDDPTAKSEILALRSDPRINALMAGEFARDNQAHLERTVGGDVGPTDLYLAHFLGAGGAARFLTAMRADPSVSAAGLFPDAAAANPTVFTDTSTGTPRSLGDVYGLFNGKVERAMAMVDGAPSPAQRAGAIEGTRGSAGNRPMFDHGQAGPLFATATTGPSTSAGMLAGLGDKSLSLFTVLTLSALSVPGEDGQDGLPGGSDDRQTQTARFVMPTGT